MASLMDDIRSACTQAEINERNFHKIAAKVSGVHKIPNNVEIGNGMILETIGFTSGNALLRAIKNTPDFEFVVPLLEQGRLKASSPLVSQAMQGFVNAGVINQSQADALVALGQSSVTVSWEQCQAAFEKEGI